MIMELLFISKWGGTFNLTDNPFCWLTNVDGMTNATTDIASVVIGGIDGDFVNNIQAQPRGIIMDLRVKQHVNVETAKRAITQIVKLKQPCTLQWTQNGRTLTIQGVVDSVVMPRFNNEVTMQISIHCAQPFWEDLNEVISEISETIPLHYFTYNPYGMLYFPQSGIPFSEYDTSRTRTFVNAGDVAVGMIIEIVALGVVTNPIIYAQNGKFFGVGYGSKTLTMHSSDKLIINTKVGEKSVTINGYPLLNYVKPQSTWLQLEAGENEFSVNSDDDEIDNMQFNLIYKQRYI